MASPSKIDVSRGFTVEKRLERARDAVREIERFCYRIVSDAVEEKEIREAREILRLAVGLRRKLDSWRSNGE